MAKDPVCGMIVDEKMLLFYEGENTHTILLDSKVMYI